MRILTADDDAVSRRLLEATLVRLGHEVASVTDGHQAIDELLRPNGPRLAILDRMITMDERARVTRKDFLDDLERRYAERSKSEA